MIEPSVHATAGQPPTPQAQYQTKAAERRKAAQAHAATYRKVGAARLALFISGAAILWRVMMGHPVFAWWLVPVVIFSVALLALHQRIFRAQRRCERAAEFYERGLARLAGQWAGTGQTGERFRNAAHPYADDLDLFGKGSLFELICTARTRAGEETLAAWLLAPAAPEEIRLRQEAVNELRTRLDLREDLALLGEDLQAGLHPEALARWGASPPVLTSWALRLVAALLSVLAAVAIGIWFSGSPLDTRPFLLALLVEGGFALWLRPRVMQVVKEVTQPCNDLQLLAQVLARFEREQFTSQKLTGLRAALETDGLPPSKRIARLRLLNDWLDARLNQAFRPISAPFL